ncbi:uncharacterized protein LOC124274628 [Haliotis rubra]|uniref:uncharacterized protein LOC124274628 n=1 Tax=Haliotis rubra TaxID=36100 RepID=UPI001EE54688|nr:uncharacterized protein LOC124274628 [Haliotis rubra]XP_046565944.1 uncharacterized protein LOC124274628 [Haliotis rubra]XP_046565945.1 uncharacterized protein LOC124274628 [Haliotis rubra]
MRDDMAMTVRRRVGTAGIGHVAEKTEDVPQDASQDSMETRVTNNVINVSSVDKMVLTALRVTKTMARVCWDAQMGFTAKSVQEPARTNVWSVTGTQGVVYSVRADGRELCVVEKTVPLPVTPKQQQGDKPTEAVTTKSGLMSMFEDQDYLLPVVGCALVILIIVAVVIFWRCKRRSKSKTPGNEEEGQCDSVSQHPSVHRLFNSGGTDSHYDEIVDDMDGMKKRLLEDRALPRIPTPENKPLACLRNRSGNLSTPYMSPIVEAVEEEEEEEPKTTPKVVFTVEPPSDEETTVGRDSLASDDSGSPVDGPEFVKRNGSLVFDTEAGDGAAGMPEKHVDLLNVPGRGIFIFQNGSNVENGSYGDYTDSCNSGLSTPKVPDMYLHNAPDSNSQLATNIADHLDKYLSQRQNTEADPEDGYETPLQYGSSDTGVSEPNVFTGTNTEHQSEKNSKDKRRLNSEAVPENEYMTPVHNGTTDTGVSDSGVRISANTEEQNEKNNNDKRRFKSKLPLPKSKTKYNHKSFVPKRDTRLNIDASEKESMLNHRDTIDC